MSVYWKCEKCGKMWNKHMSHCDCKAGKVSGLMTIETHKLKKHIESMSQEHKKFVEVLSKEKDQLHQFQKEAFDTIENIINNMHSLEKDEITVHLFKLINDHKSKEIK